MIQLTQTCWACPEQYDATHNGKQTAYLRLRHGHFTVRCPDVGGTLVYESSPKGDGDFCDEERQTELNNAVVAIYKWLGEQGPLYEMIGNE